MLDGLGMEVEAVPTANHPMVLGRYEVDPGLPTMLLYGHYDVQPPEPVGAVEEPARSSRRSATAASGRAASATTRASISRN